MLELSLAVALSLWALLSWFGTIIGLPGNWSIVLTAGICSMYWKAESYCDVPTSIVIWLVGISVLGEFIEFATGAAGVGKLGGSKRSAVLAIVGSLVGAIAGLFIGLPIPIVGSVVASILLSGLGAGLGATLGEKWAGREWEDNYKVGIAAFWGRLLGTLGKVACGMIMLILFLAAIWF